MLPKLGPLLVALSFVVGCKQLGGPGSDEPPPEPVTIYGMGDAPDKAPSSCKELGKIEVSRVAKPEPPEDDLIDEARKLDGNAVARVRKDRSEDGYLGKTYYFRATVLRCPKGAASKKGSSSTPSSSVGEGEDGWK